MATIENPPLILRLIIPLIIIFIGFMLVFKTLICVNFYFKIRELFGTQRYNPFWFFGKLTKENLFVIYKVSGIIIFIIGIFLIAGVFFWRFFS